MELNNGYGSPIDDFVIILLFYHPTFSLPSYINSQDIRQVV